MCDVLIKTWRYVLAAISIVEECAHKREQVKSLTHLKSEVPHRHICSNLCELPFGVLFREGFKCNTELLFSLFLQVICLVCSHILFPITCIRAPRVFLHLHTGRDVFSSSDHEEREWGGGRERGRERVNAELKMRVITPGLSAGVEISTPSSHVITLHLAHSAPEAVDTLRWNEQPPQTLRLLQDATKDMRNQLITLFLRHRSAAILSLFTGLMIVQTFCVSSVLEQGTVLWWCILCTNIIDRLTEWPWSALQINTPFRLSTWWVATRQCSCSPSSSPSFPVTWYSL